MLEDGRRRPAEHAREDGHVGVKRGVGSEGHGRRSRRDGRGAVLEFGADLAGAQGEKAVENLLELGVSERGDQDSDDIDRVGADCEEDERQSVTKGSQWLRGAGECTCHGGVLEDLLDRHVEELGREVVENDSSRLLHHAVDGLLSFASCPQTLTTLLGKRLEKHEDSAKEGKTQGQYFIS